MSATRMRRERYSEADLSRKIAVDGIVYSIREVSAEDFDQYIFSILEQMYCKQEDMLTCYEERFDYDYTYQIYRVFALNELYKLNLARRGTTPPKPKIPLFIEEETAHV